jgi:TonB family protein
MRLSLVAVALVVLAGCASAPPPHAPAPASPHAQAPASPPAARSLAPPLLIAPRDGAAFGTYPRVLEMHWSEVPGAVRYGVEVDYHHEAGWNLDANGSDLVMETLARPAYTMNFVGNQPGRWRAWAIDREGRRGEKSEWRVFTWDAPPPPAPPAVTGANGVTMPRAVYSPSPPYPDSARKSKLVGNVLVQVTVGADGLVKDAKVLRSLSEDLDRAALATVKVWRFEPALKDGLPVATFANIEISFNLK